MFKEANGDGGGTKLRVDFRCFFGEGASKIVSLGEEGPLVRACRIASMGLLARDTGDELLGRCSSEVDSIRSCLTWISWESILVDPCSRSGQNIDKFKPFSSEFSFHTGSPM